MDSNHRRRTPADLQSAPFGHSGIFPISFITVGPLSLTSREPMEGFEPTTPRLQITCSGQLSYIGIQPLRDAKVGIFFIFANFLSIFFQMHQLFCFRALLSLVQRTEIIRFVYQRRKIECKYNDSFPTRRSSDLHTLLVFVGKDGFEPPKSKDSRFTVCPIWPLWNLPELPFF